MRSNVLTAHRAGAPYLKSCLWLAPHFRTALTASVKGWFGDLFRAGWALPYWNTRKTLFVLNRRRGACPCHNPSDVGSAHGIGCEAVLGWRKPERFQRWVCPHLVPQPNGTWRCGVPPARVGPFWGKALRAALIVLVTVWLLGVVTVFGVMRRVGYNVSFRQVAWPPAWSELRAVRATYFLGRAQEFFTAGDASAAILALNTSYQLTPENYGTGLILAKFQAVGNPVAADRLFVELMRRNPELRAETAQAWLRVLLANGRLPEVATLARTELAAGSAGGVAWLHALVTAARLAGDAKLLSLPEEAPGVSQEMRAVLELEKGVLAAAPAEAAKQLLTTPMVENFPYARQQRAELLIDHGRPREALALLAASASQLEGRVVVGLALAASAQAGDGARRERDGRSLLAPERNPGAAEISLLALHLIEYPHPELLKAVQMEWRSRLATREAPHAREATLAVLAAAAVGGSEEEFAAVREMARATGFISAAEGRRMQQSFFPPTGRPQVYAWMGAVPDLPMELSYALNRWALRSAGDRGPRG